MTNYTKDQNTNTLLKDILNINDKNIVISSSYKENIKGQLSQVFEGVLLHNDHCPKCRSKQAKLHVHTHKQSLITMPKVSEFNTYLKLDKIRYKCSDCGRTHVPSTTLTNFGCFISNKVRDVITIRLSKRITMKYISEDTNVSQHSVIRVLDTAGPKKIRKVIKNYLPEVLHFDEFKSTKDAKGNMSFIMMDGDLKRVIDIVENRQKNNLLKYFVDYTIEARKNVKKIVIDMYEPYMSLIKDIFPNAIIILDRFHISQNLTRAFNKTRTQIMKKDKKNRNKYKKHWKNFLQLETDLSMKRYKNICFKYNYMSNKEVVQYVVDDNEEFRINYEYYQKVLFALKYKDISKLKEVLALDRSEISSYLQTCMSTYDKYIDYIENAFVEDYNNGLIEGKISHIKTLKTISCGFRKYTRFKCRIMMIENQIIQY